MTEDYNKVLIAYLTGKLENTSSTSDEIIQEQTDIARSVWEPYLPNHWKNFRFEGMVAASETTSSLGVLYGGYIDNDDNVRGIIVLVNESFEPVKTFYEFDGGTPLRYIQYMKQAEDGTFYFIDDAVFSYTQKQESSTAEKRLIMVNNITANTDELDKVVLRKAYILPSNLKNFYCHNMFKDPNSAHYVFFGSGVDTNSAQYNWRLLKIYDLKIEYGETPTWTSLVSQNQALFGSAFAQFDTNSKCYFRCVWTNNLNSSNDINCYTKTYEGNPTNETIFTRQDYKPYIDEGFQKKQSVFININEVYFVQNNSYWGNAGVIRPKYIGLYKHDFSNNTNTTIFEKYLGDYDYTYQEYIMIDKNNNKLYIEYFNNYDKDNATADIYMQRYEGVWNPILIGENKPYVFDRQSMFVKNNFNLLQIYSYGINPQSRIWNYFVVKEDYNLLNYNGEAYINNNALVPFKTRLYSNNYLVFARNLFNITKQNNMTMSSVEIPNTYLNGIDIVKNNLLSKTNLEMNNDLNGWNKNIYEVVDLNFLNTITIIDEDTNTPYLNGAIKLNQATTDGGSTNYTNAPCTKYRINYADNTTDIQELEWIDIDAYTKQTKISLYVDKIMLSIDLLSYDESTIYLTIPLNVEIDKYYTIKQKVRIGEKPIPVQLQYNNEEVLYNNQSVMVYVRE